MPAEPLEFTVSGPAAVPYGEPAVFTITLNNPTALPAEVMDLYPASGALEVGSSGLWLPFSDEAPALERVVEPGASLTWTATFVDTRFAVMDDYTFSIGLDGVFLDGGARSQLEFSETAAHMFTIASPVRPLDSHWNDYCQLKKALYWAGQVEVTRRECKDGYDEADPTCWEDAESEYWEARNAVLLRIQETEDALSSFVDEWGDEYKDRRFPTLSDQYACDCWCRANPEHVCDNIPWGTTADLPSYIEDPSEHYVPPLPGL